MFTLMLEDGPDALQLLEDFFTEVGWDVTFEIVCQLASCCYDPFLGNYVWVGNLFVLVEHCVQDSCDPNLLHQQYP